MTDQPLPASLEAERAVLGAVLLDNRKYGEARGLTMEYFSLESHRKVFGCIAELLDVDQSQADVVTLVEKLKSRNELESVKGAAFVSSLTEGVPQRASIQHHVDILISKYQSRKLIYAAQLAIERAYDQADKPEDILADLQENTLRISSSNPQTDTNIFLPAHAFVNQIREDIDWRVERIIETGTSGFIQAPPGSAKSFLAAQLAVSLASGERFFGMKVKQSRVALVSREDHSGTTASRIRRIEIGMGIDPGWTHVGDNLWVSTRAQVKHLMLDNPHDLATLIKNLQRQKTEFLILDVLAVLHGADENDNTEMRSVLKRVETIRDEVGCDVCIIHHSKKNPEGGARLKDLGRGASSIGGFAEFIIGLEDVDEDQHVRQMKFFTKAAESYWPFYWHIRDDINNSVILERTEYEPPKSNIRSRAERAMGR